MLQAGLRAPGAARLALQLQNQALHSGAGTAPRQRPPTHLDDARRYRHLPPHRRLLLPRQLHHLPHVIDPRHQHQPAGVGRIVHHQHTAQGQVAHLQGLGHAQEGSCRGAAGGRVGSSQRRGGGRQRRHSHQLTKCLPSISRGSMSKVAQPRAFLGPNRSLPKASPLIKATEARNGGATMVLSMRGTHRRKEYAQSAGGR